MRERPRPEPGQEPVHNTYRRAARYDGDRASEDAKRAYERSRRDLHRAPEGTEVSVFRLQIGQLIGDVAYLGWYVALIGTQPNEALAARLERHLADGTAVELPKSVITMLEARRADDTELAPWVERRLGQLMRAETNLFQRSQGNRKAD